MKVKFSNDKARRFWLEQYHAWGLWFLVPNTGAKWYRCYLPDGTMFAVEEYPEVNHHTGYCEWTSHVKHLYMTKPGEPFDGGIQTEGALLGEIHGLRGEVDVRYPDNPLDWMGDDEA